MTTITKHVPGKLFLAGEYAVTFTNQPAIITSVPAYLTVTVSDSVLPTIYSTQTDIEMTWTRHCQAIVPLEENHYPHVIKTIEVVEQYVIEHHIALKSYDITIDSQLDDIQSGKKFGFGSSGALCVALTRALLHYYGLEDTNILVFKLATIAQIALQSNGSFGDIAACTYDTLIAYSRVDREWLTQQLAQHPLKIVVHSEWKDLIIKPINWPSNLVFCFGWTNSPASSQQLVDSVTKRYETETFQQFLATSKACVTTLIEAFETNNTDDIVEQLTINRSLLQNLSPYIETDALKRLILIAEQFGEIGKSSGAGGGDCGFAVVKNYDNIAKIHASWIEYGITPLFTLGGNYGNIA